MSTFYRIKRHVRPYGGRRLEVDDREAASNSIAVMGHVHVSRFKIATAERTYLRSELEEIQQ